MASRNLEVFQQIRDHLTGAEMVFMVSWSTVRFNLRYMFIIEATYGHLNSEFRWP